MDFGSLIKGFFGLKRPKPDSFLDDSKCQDCQRHEGSSEKGSSSTVDLFFHDGDQHFHGIMQPVDPFSVFQQMEDVVRGFFSHRSGRMLGFPFDEDPSDDLEGCHDFLLNPSERISGGFFGDEFGREGDSEFSSIESFLQPKSPRDLALKPFYKDSQNSVESELLQDSDLDGSVLNGGGSSDLLKDFRRQPEMDKRWSFSKSVSIRTIRGPDGTIEEHRTVRDSSGNEVTTVHKSIGGQSYSVTLHKDSEGVKEKKEDFFNLDEKDVPQFEEKWHNIKDNFPYASKEHLIQQPGCLREDTPGDPYYSSIFEKLFKL